MNDFKTGDRVASTVAGFYMGMPAKIIDKCQMQYGNFTRYNIELDTGKRIALASNHLQRLAVSEPITPLEKEWRDSFDKWQE